MYARNVYAQLLAAQKRFDEMLSLSEESLQMDPQSLDALVNHGMLLYYKRDYAAAEQVSRRALSMQPGDEAALLLLTRVIEAQGRFGEALATANEAARLAGDAGVNLQRRRVIRLQALRTRRQARVAAAELEKAGRTAPCGSARGISRTCTPPGTNEDALDQFERALDERDPADMADGGSKGRSAEEGAALSSCILAKIGLD